MRHIGLLPLKTQSNTIAGKNRRKLLGRPLFCWVLSEALNSKLDMVVVATNDDSITDFIAAHYTWTNKIKVISRSKSSENGLLVDIALEYQENTSDTFDTLSVLNATNPFITSKDINRCLEALVDGNASATTVVSATKRHVWNNSGDQLDISEDLQWENKGIYATTSEALSSSKKLLSGTIIPIEMPQESALELKTISDWEQMELRLAKRLMASKENKKVKYLVLDVDGVFTDGSVLYDEHGEMAKLFDIRDGMGLEIMREQGIDVVIMTSEDSMLVRKRMEKLKITHVFLNAKDKYALLEHFIEQQNCSRAEIAYVGDDVNDLANLCSVGWSLAPKNATSVVLSLVDIVLSKNSGNGAIREATEFLLKYNQRYF